MQENDYLDSQVAGNNRPLYPKVDHYWFKVAHNSEPLAYVLVELCKPNQNLGMGLRTGKWVQISEVWLNEGTFVPFSIQGIHPCGMRLWQLGGM